MVHRNLIILGILTCHRAPFNSIYQTRMDSSRMHTTRLLPVSPSMHCSKGVYLPGKGEGICTCPEVYLPGGCTCPGRGVYLPVVVYLPRGYLPREVPVQGGVPSHGGVPSQGGTCTGGVPVQGGVTCPGTPPPPTCEQNSWDTLLKILPCPNLVAG